MHHELKTHPDYFQAVKRGEKPFELRQDDRPYAVGDTLILREWDADKYRRDRWPEIGTGIPKRDAERAAYTGDQLCVRVTYVLRGGDWLNEGYCALGIATDASQELAALTEANIQLWSALEEQQTCVASLRNQINKLITERDLARAELQTRTAECTRLLEEVQAMIRPQGEWEAEVEETARDLTRCAAAHQKALEQTEHYGVALTQLALAGNITALETLGRAPHEDRTRAAWRELKQEVSILQSVAAAAQRYNERPYGVENGALRIQLDQAVQAYGEWLRQARVSSSGPVAGSVSAEETRALMHPLRLSLEQCQPRLLRGRRDVRLCPLHQAGGERK